MATQNNQHQASESEAIKSIPWYWPLWRVIPHQHDWYEAYQLPMHYYGGYIICVCLKCKKGDAV